MAIYEMPAIKNARAAVEKTRARMGNAALEVFFRNKFNYGKTFAESCGRYVLEDLSKFVRLNDDLFRDDPRKVDYLLGQRSVVLRILRMMKMTDEEIYNLTNTKD